MNRNLELKLHRQPRPTNGTVAAQSLSAQQDNGRFGFVSAGRTTPHEQFSGTRGSASLIDVPALTCDCIKAGSGNVWLYCRW
jgi:hypothetical protein